MTTNIRRRRPRRPAGQPAPPPYSPSVEGAAPTRRKAPPPAPPKPKVYSRSPAAERAYQKDLRNMDNLLAASIDACDAILLLAETDALDRLGGEWVGLSSLSSMAEAARIAAGLRDRDIVTKPLARGAVGRVLAAAGCVSVSGNRVPTQAVRAALPMLADHGSPKGLYRQQRLELQKEMTR